MIWRPFGKGFEPLILSRHQKHKTDPLPGSKASLMVKICNKKYSGHTFEDVYKMVVPGQSGINMTVKSGEVNLPDFTVSSRYR